jgi:hypothetical protein
VKKFQKKMCFDFFESRLKRKLGKLWVGNKVKMK